MKIIEPDYVKASKYFCLYWSIYLASLCIYYRTLLIELIFTYCALFWLIHEIYKENYLLSNSLTEIFYDFHNDPIVFYEGGQNIKVNRSFLSHFGYLVKTRKMKHHSQMLTEIVNPEKIIFTMRQSNCEDKISLLDVLKNKKKMEQVELSLMKMDVEKVFMFTFYKLENIYDDKTVCILKNITHVHQLQKVKSQVEFRSVIMGCLTHELRTPINCVISILRSLEEYLDSSDEAKKLLMVCQGTIEMLRSLTEDFIDFTRFENEKGLPIKKEWVNMKEFFQEISNIFSFQASEKDLRFDINFEANMPKSIYTDPKRVKQVVLNLLSNSFKFTQRGKIEISLSVNRAFMNGNKNHFTIEQEFHPSKSLIKGFNLDTGIIKSSSLDEMDLPIDSAKHVKDFGGKKAGGHDFTVGENMRNYLFIEVIDTGLGVCEKDRRELFTKFGTGKNSRGLNTNGLGLGLYLSKEICLKLGGDITCESIEGIGSTFMIKLPFDPIYEMKELLDKNSSDTSNVYEMITDEFIPHINNDFQEFVNIDTKDSIIDNMPQTYYFKIPKSQFRGNNTLRTPEISCSPSSDYSPSRRISSIISGPEPLKIKTQSSNNPDFEIVKNCSCKKILVVDDLAFNLFAVELMIKKKFGLIVDKAFSGDEAIVKVKQKFMSP